LSRNDLDLYVENPQKIDNRITLRMGGSAADGGQDVIYFLGYPVTSTIRAQADYMQNAQIVRVSGIKQLSSQMSTSLTGTHDPFGPGVLVGFSWWD
jgi:hypothetical protein